MLAQSKEQTALAGSSHSRRRHSSAIAWLFCVTVLFAASTDVVSAKDDLASLIDPLVENHKGKVGVMVKHLESGESYAYRENEPMATASLIKFPLMVAAYQAIEDGQLMLDQYIELKEDDKVPGSGILTSHFSAGTKLTLRDAIHLMIVYSDNTSTNLVVDQVGLSATGELMKSLGCPHSVLHSKVYRRDTSIFPERSKEFGLGSTSAADMIRLLEALQKDELVSASASKKMKAHMSAVEGAEKIPLLLPAGTKVYHKGGSVSATRTDAGVILSPAGPIAVCVLTTDNEDRSWVRNNAGDMLCSKVAKVAYDYFNANVEPEESGPVVLKVGSGGLLVESLQRTLNAKLNPSPDLGVDGDFGPMTEGAVVAFQKSKNLPETGEVGPDTWKALGTLVEESQAPDPAEINSQTIEKKPADTLTGPPFVTCKAWAIGDAETGKLLWGFNESQVRDIASTTKIMTGYLVTSLAKEDPSILQEQLVFSRRADNTIGSSARVRAGESILVDDLLYGLLLPSGNDASVALAEHFGERLSEGSSANGDSYDHFIQAMNAKAKELGMAKSSFANPNGLTQKGHQSTAEDLLILAHNAMQQPLFRKYVSTVQHGCTVTGAEGYQRNLAWYNTNRLLRTEGFVGVKTGTTTPAGACLVSQGKRGDKSLIVVVLGASSTDARYADSQNLYRWAWRELGL